MMLSLSSCVSVGASQNNCSWVKPILVHEQDVFTPTTARTILTHNETWEEDDISVIVENLELTIKGEKQDSDTPPKHMSYKGISTKNFSKKFVLAPHYVVTDATLKHGLLTIEVKHFLPEELKSREIKIST